MPHAAWLVTLFRQWNDIDVCNYMKVICASGFRPASWVGLLDTRWYNNIDTLYGLSPKYLVKDCELVAAADRRQLRSSDVATFVVPRTNTRLGDRAFPVAGTRLWNSLPSNLRQSDLTLRQFRRALKTYLFGWPRLQHLVTFVFSVLYKCS